ncbi:MAG TPA: gliding motility-associated C-terminal domain-containing protein, partial [Bacteroidia bacterium]|nr:gliding motility-associated C-terminal domain-containing protein [Bacteroidia bacterium]
QDGYFLNEIDPSATDSDFSGYNGLAVGCFLFSYDGIVVKKWDKGTGALLGQVTVTAMARYTVGGIATDACGNVYVGIGNSVQQYDANLVLLNTVATTGMVYDVHLGNTSGEVLACGQGFASSMTFPVGACAPTTVLSSTPSTGCPCNGTATVSPQAACVGGNFTYNWIPIGGNNATATGLCPGTYSVVITDLNTGVIDTQTVVVGGTPVSVTATISGTNPTCGNSNNGSATVNPSGGNAPYTYLWTPGNQTTQTATGLGAGTYTVFIWDADSCSTQQTIILTAPPPFTVVASQLAQIMCFADCNGSVTATPGGAGPYTYSWNSAPIQTSQTATGLCAGTYIVTVSDTNNCTTLDTITISEPTALNLQSSPAASVCVGSCANINVMANGGSPTYSYLWMPGGATTSAITVCPATTTMYTVTVTDNNNCQRLDSVLVTVLPLPVPVFSVDQQTGCELLCVNFTNQTPNSATVTWIYGDNTQGPSANHCYTAGTYDVSLVIVGTNGCTDTVTYANYITAFPNPTAAFTVDEDHVSLWEPAVCAVDQSTNAVTWAYDFADPNNPGIVNGQNPCHLYSDTGTYCIQLVVASVDGCLDTAVVCIEVFEEPGTVYIPNTFTPNGSGLNDYFLPVGVGISSDNYHFMIFNRWGELIWETYTWGEGWNGVPKGATAIAQIDTYVWKISCRDDLGNNIARIGHVNLIR